MPSVFENIAYLWSTHVAPRSRRLVHIVLCLIAMLAVSVAIETFVFNFNYFATRGYTPVSMNTQIELRQNDSEQFLVTEVDRVIEFSDLDREVNNIWIDFDGSQAAQEVTLKIQFTDEAHQTYFDSTEYTVGIPEVGVSTCSAQSKYINLNTSGKVGSLRIEIVDEDVSYPIYLNNLVLNAQHPFDFNMVRFLLLFGALCLVYILRPRSSVYRILIVDNPVLSKASVIAAVCVEIALLSGYLFFGSNLVGVATSSYNYGEWDGVSLVNVYETGGDNAQQYAELAKAMADGQLYLEVDPPEWLQNMDDPYDKGARDELQKETGESYLFDVAYYDGHYYVYFGVVPVLLFYLPFYLLTGQNFPTAIGVLIALIAFVLGCSVLLDRFARYHFKRVSLGLYLLLQMPMVACSGILYLAKFPTFYSLPISCALAFSVWGLYFWMRGRAAERREGWYLAGSACMAVVVGCRPTLLLLSLLAFPLFWRPYITERRLFTKKGAREFACLLAPYFIAAAGIMWYNYARFGSLTDFGANYNLTVNDMTKRGMNIGRLAPAFFSYFLQPPNVTGVFPFLQPTEFETTYMGQTIREVTFGGVFACLPVLWIIPFAVRILKMRIRQRSTRTIAGVIVVLLGSALVMALLDAEVAGILQRYYADFSFMLLAAAVLLAFIVNENIESATTRTVLLSVTVVAVGISLVYSVLICFIPETGWYSSMYPWAYQDIIEMVQFWT